MEKRNEVVNDVIFNFLGKVAEDFQKKYRSKGYLTVIGTFERDVNNNRLSSSIIGHKTPNLNENKPSDYTRLIEFKTT
jgi:hypothetical protein